MKCGDIILNHWAGKDNPSRHWLFIRKSGRYLIGLSFYKGVREIRFYNDKETLEKSEIVGHIDIESVINKLNEI